MRKTKTFAFIASILLFTAGNFSINFSISPALAAEEDFSAEKTNLSAEITFEAEAESTEIKNDGTAELKKSLELLRAEIAEMKSGMKQLQAKIVEAEMEKLSDQLSALQKEIAEAGKADFEKTEIPKFDFGFTPAPQTLPVTKIEDFVDFNLNEEISKSEKETETAEKIETAEAEKNSELAKKLETAEAEIEELKATLAKKEELEKDKAVHAEVIGKVEKIKAAKEELEKVAVEDAVEKLKKKGEAEEIKKTSNIIAQANGEIFFQFPRSLTRKSGTTGMIAENKTLAAENLKAGALEIKQPAAKENNFKRSSAPKKEFSLFSARSIAVLGGMLGIAVAVFIVWLLRHERRLLAATSRRFQQLDFKPNFDLNSRARKLFRRNKKPSPRENDTIQ